MNALDKAFPSGIQPDNYARAGESFDSGLTVRDYIAIKAMAVIIANSMRDPRDILPSNTASLAYKFADAMINHTNKE